MKQSPLVLVTGANRGIGFEICRQLLARDATVVLTARSPEAAAQAARSLGGEGPRLSTAVLDVRDSRQMAELVRNVESHFGQLDVLINNAGINVDGQSTVATVTAERVRETLETNTIAPLELTQRLLPLLRKAAPARVINISSSMAASGNGMVGYPAYRIAKMALNSITLQLSRELAADRIAVNSVCPGWVRTDLGGPHAPNSVEQGADTPVWLALDAPETLTGKFISERQEIPW